MLVPEGFHQGKDAAGTPLCGFRLSCGQLLLVLPASCFASTVHLKIHKKCMNCQEVLHGEQHPAHQQPHQHCPSPLGGGGMGTYKMLWKDLTSPHPPHSKCQAPMLFLWELEHLGQPKGKPMAAVPPWAELQRRQHALQSSDGPVLSSLGLGCSPTTLNISCPSALNQGLLLIKVAEFLL